MYGDSNPAAVLHHEKPTQITEDRKYYQIKMRLPFVDAEDIELSKYGDELVIDVGNRRKSIFLPRFTNFLEMRDYWFDAEYLTIRLYKS